MISVSRENGAVSFKMLSFFVVIFIIVHLGIKLVPMYMDAERMKDEMAVKARFSQTLKDDEIIADLVKKAKDLDLPLGPGSFSLFRDEDKRTMKIATKWDVTLHFFFDVYPELTTRTYHFEPIIQEDYSTKL